MKVRTQAGSLSGRRRMHQIKFSCKDWEGSVAVPWQGVCVWGWSHKPSVLPHCEVNHPSTDAVLSSGISTNFFVCMN